MIIWTREGRRFIFEDCPECDDEIRVEVFLGPNEGEEDYDFPEACPHCGHSLDSGRTDFPEDFHSDI